MTNSLNNKNDFHVGRLFRCSYKQKMANFSGMCQRINILGL